MNKQQLKMIMFHEETLSFCSDKGLNVTCCESCNSQIIYSLIA